MSFRAHVTVCCLLALTAVSSARGNDLYVRLPLSSTDSREVKAEEAERSEFIIRTNACGQEPKYVAISSQMAAGDLEGQGEGLIQLLTAKIQWLQTQTGPCEARIVIQEPEEDNPSSDGDARLQAFVNRYFADLRWRDPAHSCSAETSSLAARFVDEPRLVEGVNTPKRYYRITASFSVSRDCLKQQINASIRAMKKDRRMGTEAAPFCILDPGADTGADYDMTMKELMRVLYLSGAAAGRTDVLEPGTIKHMYKELLAARGNLGPASFNIFSDCADSANEELGTPEDYADRQNVGGDILDFLDESGGWLLNFGISLLAFAAANALLGPVSIAAWATIHLIGVEQSIVDLTSAPFDLRIPETENHRLMIESSRYLTNAAIIRELKRIRHDNVDEVIDDQKNVREWLLKDLQRIANKDFDEYNSRPYTRLSLEAIQNLHDFADDRTADGDPAMRIAARIVLDLSAAKFAAGSNRGRRNPPYRRLSDSDGTKTVNDDGSPVGPRHFYHQVSGSDHEITRAQFLSGQVQPIEEVTDLPTDAQTDALEIRKGAKTPINITSNMVNTATSSYRLPTPIMEVATERIFPFEQVVNHAGIEVYYAHPAFTMTLGGAKRPAALSVLFGAKDNAEDRGTAVQTSLIPTQRGALFKETFQFAGAKNMHDRADNMCGWKGFICGIKPIFADACVVNERQPDGSTLHFVSSALTMRKNTNECVAPTSNKQAGSPVRERHSGPHFFLAAKTAPCDDEFCPRGQDYGIMEMIEASLDDAYADHPFNEFKEQRKAAMLAWRTDRSGDGTYQNDSGETIEFRVAENDDDGGYSRLWKVNGVLPYTGSATHGAMINRSSPEGKVSIESPWSGARIDIDFTDFKNPRITDVPAPAGGRAQLYTVQTTGGSLVWHKHWRALGPQPGEKRLQGPKPVGKAWDKYSIVTAAIGSPVVYAMDANGDLFWFRHDGFRFGVERWRGPIKVGNGWNAFNTIVAGENGVLYGRFPNGDLRWHRHLGHADGTVSWAGGVIVGTGWHGYTNILAGNAGVLYGIKPDGDLMWHRHVGHQEGTTDWVANASRVGNGWNGMKAVVSTGNGIIYVVKPDGELFWYRHLGQANGEIRWANNVAIGSGWGDFKFMFASSPAD